MIDTCHWKTQGRVRGCDRTSQWSGATSGEGELPAVTQYPIFIQDIRLRNLVLSDELNKCSFHIISESQHTGDTHTHTLITRAAEWCGMASGKACWYVYWHSAAQCISRLPRIIKTTCKGEVLKQHETTYYLHVFTSIYCISLSTSIHILCIYFMHGQEHSLSRFLHVAVYLKIRGHPRWRKLVRFDTFFNAGSQYVILQTSMLAFIIIYL